MSEANASIQYWKLSPGINAKWWDEWKSTGVCAIGWPDLGDVRGLTPQEVERRRAEIEVDPQFQSVAQWYTPSRVQQVWKFTHEIKIGDWILANRGTSEVLGWGIVTGPCEFHPEHKEFPNQLSVRWMKFEPRAVKQGGWLRTLIELTREKFQMLIGATDSKDENTKVEIIPPMKTKEALNQILYGPPGTGKTHNAIHRAVEVIDGREYSRAAELRGEVKARFDELKREGRIGFVTFHQSFGYEDFIEGIRPVLDESTQTGARYECRDGVLKQIAERALYNSAGGTNNELIRVDFETLWREFVENFSDSSKRLPGLTNKNCFNLTFANTGVEGRDIESPKHYKYHVTKEQAAHIFTHLHLHHGQRADRDAVLTAAGAARKSEFESKAVFISAIISELQRIQIKLQSNLSTDKEPSRYVLIIDEINRGNISKILGELITLLECDKRIGAANELKVQLPYSGEEFGLPQNLFIIGTMNTADKSLALLDVALRRRFKFYEYAPDFAVCGKLDDEMRRVLRELNHRITLRKDRDHRIGHSFFIDVETRANFNGVFRDEIIPLLQEYFYNDWDGLRFVLGEGEQKTRFIIPLEKTRTREARNHWRWFFDEARAEDFDCLQTLSQNYDGADEDETDDADAEN